MLEGPITIKANLTIRPALHQDDEAIWAILEPIFRAGETYALPPNIAKRDALEYWKGTKNQVFVAVANDNDVVGTYFLRPNAGGGGGHIANCGYVTHPLKRNQGVGCALCEHSIHEAITQGYEAIVFNFVISSNPAALRLWFDHSFQQVGCIPRGFRRPNGESVDVLVLHRELKALSGPS